MAAQSFTLASAYFFFSFFELPNLLLHLSAIFFIFERCISVFFLKNKLLKGLSAASDRLFQMFEAGKMVK